jgi:hypothetical protein
MSETTEACDIAINDQLEREASLGFRYSLNITKKDHETLVIVVRYHPAMDREIMNSAIETARYVIRKTIERYGWSNWVKVVENVQMSK